MLGFKNFVELTHEQEDDVEETLQRIPKHHRTLVKNYKIKFHHDNVLKGDKEHVGIINPNNKTVTVAAPWNHSRSYTFLHEIAHKVWEKYVSPQLRKEWS